MDDTSTTWADFWAGTKSFLSDVKVIKDQWDPDTQQTANTVAAQSAASTRQSNNLMLYLAIGLGVVLLLRK